MRRWFTRNPYALGLLGSLLCGSFATSNAAAQDRPNADFSHVREALLEGVAVGVEQVADDTKREAAAAKAVEARTHKMAERLRPAMNLELAFIRRASDMTDEQRKTIAADAEVVLMKLAAQHDNILNGRVVLQIDGAVVQQQGNTNREDMLTSIRQAARTTAEKHLSESQRARLETEWNHRSDAERMALIDDVVSQIDHQLHLSQEQYDNLKNSFVEKWQHAVSIRFNVGQVFTVPAVPDELVVPHLNEAQQTLWKLANKSSSYTHFNQSRTYFDEPLWEEPAEQEVQAQDEASR